MRHHDGEGNIARAAAGEKNAVLKDGAKSTPKEEGGGDTGNRVSIAVRVFCRCGNDNYNNCANRGLNWPPIYAKPGW
jgi:hypothetical protein